MDVYFNTQTLKEIDILIGLGIYPSRTDFFKEAIEYGKYLCESELNHIENIKKNDEIYVGKRKRN